MIPDPRAVSIPPDEGGVPAPVKVSFVMPLYADATNPGDIIRIGKAFGCLEMQTDKAFEIIAVADGYQPHLHAYIETKVRPIFDAMEIPFTFVQAPRRGERGGHMACRLGLEYAHGEFVCMYNGDNIVYPEYVETMYRTDADIVAGWVLMSDLPGKIILTAYDFVRGRIDRLNYAIRLEIAKWAKHETHLDSDYDFLINALRYKNGDVRTVNVGRVIGEHH